MVLHFAVKTFQIFEIDFILNIPKGLMQLGNGFPQHHSIVFQISYIRVKACPLHLFHKAQVFTDKITYGLLSVVSIYSTAETPSDKNSRLIRMLLSSCPLSSLAFNTYVSLISHALLYICVMFEGSCNPKHDKTFAIFVSILPLPLLRE